MSFPRSYYYGQYKWDKYVLDIQESVEESGEKQVEELQAQTDELRLQTEQLRGISYEIGEMRGEIRWGFNLVVDRMDQQIELFTLALEKLDAIHKTLRSPLMTQAKELFDWGEDRFHKGLYDKSLEAFLQSEQKNEVNFLLQLRIGTLFLEGRNQDCNVVDLPSAERHLLLAVRYAQAEDKTVSNWDVFCGEAYYRAGVAAYLIGEQMQKIGDLQAMRTSLERALEHLGKALKLHPEFTGTLYSQAKCHALLGRKEEALNIFVVLSDRDRRYYANVLEDGDFSEIRSDIEEVFKLAVENPGKLARAASARTSEAVASLGWAKSSNPESARDIAVIASYEEVLKRTPQLLQSVHVDIEDLNKALVETKRRLLEIGDGTLSNRVASIQSQINSLTSRSSYCEGSIKTLGQKMAQTKVMGWGCLITVFAVGPWSAAAVAALMVARPFLVENFGEYSGAAFASAIMAGALISGIVGARIVRSIKNRTLRDEVAQRSREIEDCGSQIPPLQTKLVAAQKQMADFLAWRQV